MSAIGRRVQKDKFRLVMENGLLTMISNNGIFFQNIVLIYELI